jgi:excisionase family DNA binding protein
LIFISYCFTFVAQPKDNRSMDLNQYFDTLKADLRQAVREEVQQCLSNLPPAGTEIMNSVEVAEALHISLPTVHKWKTGGKLPFHRQGRRVYFLRSEIMAALRQQPASLFRYQTRKPL